jgi:small subunit ribosomal protein S20
LATHKSAEKRHRQSEKRRARNHALRSRLRRLVKRVDGALQRRNVAEAEIELRAATRELDKAVTKGVLHRNNASRRLSRLTLRLNAIRAAS